MKEIIQPIDRDLLVAELSKQSMKTTKRLENSIYFISATDCPYLMLEIGRLREVTFRAAGGGTGKEVDIDEYDYHFSHIVLWDSNDQEIIGSYRAALMKELKTGQKIYSPNAQLFNFSKKFISDYLPYTIELGRSFVQPKYQPRVDNKNGIFSLFNLFSGLECLIDMHSDMKYFFGKFTMYSHYDVRARNLLLNYLKRKFPDPDKLVRPKKKVKLHLGYVRKNLFLLQTIFNQKSFKEEKKLLEVYLKQYGEYIQPLVDIYMGLSPTMRVFGGVHYEEFGNVDETGILISIQDIHPEIIDRYRKNIK